MKVEKFVQIMGADFYTGVPDSQLKALCNYLMDIYALDEAHHIIAANEGNCVALAAGYHLATDKVPVVYLQNSGEGNIINPAASLLSDKVYAIPAIFVIGWRGEPGIHDEPQHIYQGEVTLKLLEDMDIRSFVIRKTTSDDDVQEAMDAFRDELAKGKSVAFVVSKDALEYSGKPVYGNENKLNREAVIRQIIQYTGDDPIVSTTGKISRELFEAREACSAGHGFDFLTVGSMGHASSIALGIAVQKTNTRIWCIDGDGAAIMHMGALAVIGTIRPDNYIHIIINNEAHESVGGLPTAAGHFSFSETARACGYPYAVSVRTMEELETELKNAKENTGLRMIEIRCALGSRSDLGRPTTSSFDNKKDFMEHLASGSR